VIRVIVRRRSLEAQDWSLSLTNVMSMYFKQDESRIGLVGKCCITENYAGLSGRPLGLLLSTVATMGFLLFGYDRE
jgi:hypothetical protein